MTLVVNVGKPIKGQSRDLRLQVALGTAWVVMLACAVWVKHPFGIAYPLSVDFAAFWSAGSLLRDGSGWAMFDHSAVATLQSRLYGELAAAGASPVVPREPPYLNPPPLALLFAPLTLLPVRLGFLLWSLVSALAFVFAVALPLRGRPDARLHAVALLGFGAVGNTLMEGQVNALFALAFSLGLLSLSSGRRFLGGALFGILWLKPQYAVVLMLVLLTKRRWTELLGAASVAVILAALSLALVGHSGLSSYWTLMGQASLFRPPPHIAAGTQLMANWKGILINMWPDISDSTGALLVLILGATAVLSSMLAWRGPWDPTSPRFARQMLVTAMATVVSAPHSHFHGSVLLLAPLALCVARPACAAAAARPSRPMLVAGYLLALMLWPLVDLSWLFAPALLLAMSVLIFQCWATGGGSSRSRVPALASRPDPLIEELHAADAKS